MMNIACLYKSYLIWGMCVCMACGAFAAESSISEQMVLESLKKHETFVHELIKSFPNCNDKNTKLAIIYALGQLRAIEGIPLLIKNIDYGTTMKNIKWLPKYGALPAAEALTKVGIPAVKPVMEAIVKEKNEFNLRTYCVILIGIYGADYAVVELNKEINMQKDETSRSRLEFVLKLAKFQIQLNAEK